VRGNIKYDDGYADTRRIAERSLMGINGAKFMDMARQAIPEHRHHAGDKKDEACGEGALGPSLQRECDGLASNLGRRKPRGTDVEKQFRVPRLGPVLVLPTAERLPQPKKGKLVYVRLVRLKPGAGVRTSSGKPSPVTK
jgi:hypothetical protein